MKRERAYEERRNGKRDGKIESGGKKKKSILSRETRIERWEERTPERGREGKK